MVSNPKFAALMQQKISMKVDTSAIEQEIANYEKQLRQSYSIKSRLIEEIDTLDPDDKHYIKRKADLDDRLYKMYDKIEDTESLLIEARAKKMAIEAEKLTADNIYKVLIYFDKLYAVMDEQERRQLMESLIGGPPPRPGRGGGPPPLSLPHVLVRHRAFVPGDRRPCPARGQVREELCPRVETIVQNINPRRSSAVLGPREKVLWGRGYIEDTLCGVRFRLGASSFYQINPEQTEVLYRTALDGVGLDGTQTVVDAYCGVGTIGLAAAGRARRVLGVEFNPSAARCAAQNARANGAGNARFLCADATACLQGMAARGERADVVFLDPPRAGSTRSSWGRWTAWGRSGSSTSPATRRRSGGISACWPDGGGGPGCSSRWISFPIRSMWSVWRCWPKSAEVVCEVRRLRSQNSMGAWRATCGARLPFYFVCYASFGGMAVATPLITTSPCWLVHTVSSLTIFFSGNSSWTVQVAVTVSPI